MGNTVLMPMGKIPMDTTPEEANLAVLLVSIIVTLLREAEMAGKPNLTELGKKGSKKVLSGRWSEDKTKLKEHLILAPVT